MIIWLLLDFSQLQKKEAFSLSAIINKNLTHKTMEAEELLLKSANEMLLRGELPQEFIDKDLPIDLIKRLLATIFLDLDIMLPTSLDANIRQIFLLMAILITEGCKLEETDVPNKYRLYLIESEGKIHALDETTKFERYLLTKLSLFLKFSYEAKKENILESFNYSLEMKVKCWNDFEIPLEERVFKLSREKSLPEIASVTSFNETRIRKILKNYETRINRKKLSNLNRFEQKITDFISKLPTDRQHIYNSIRFLLNEIANGGLNIREPEDLITKLGLKNNPIYAVSDQQKN